MEGGEHLRRRLHTNKRGLKMVAPQMPFQKQSVVWTVFNQQYTDCRWAYAIGAHSLRTSQYIPS